MIPRGNLLARFWSKVRIGQPDECWDWIGNQWSGKYGQLTICRKAVLVHRFAWEFVNGPIPANTKFNENSILHSCDNPSCCNPAHLTLGTHQQNMEDRKLRNSKVGRPRDLYIRVKPPRGPSKAKKLTEDQVYEIRAATGTMTSIAKRYGVGQPLITLIKQRKSWKHLPERDESFILRSE